VLSDRLELSAPHGRAVTGVLVFQDLMVIPFAIAVPYLGRWLGASGGAAGSGGSLTRGLLLLVVVALVFIGGRRVLPWLLRVASRAGSREAFLFGVVLVALGSAALTSWAGLSLALGAFIAGLILAESDLRTQIAADVLPFRDALSSVFFVTIGMLFEPRAVLAQPLLVLASTVGLVVVKFTAAAIALRVCGISWRVACAGAIALAQVGEFSFVLAQTGTPFGLMGAAGGQAFYAGAVFSLMLTPLLVARAPEWAIVLGSRLGGRHGPADDAALLGGEGHGVHGAPLSDHVVIAGFGLNGQNLARVLRSVRVPHVVVDLNPDALLLAESLGSRAMLGDVTYAHIQQQAGVPAARVLVLALSDPTATRHACHAARTVAPHVYIIVRTRYVAEIDELHRLGANQVIPEEFETSIEIFTATLRRLHVPMNVIQAQILLLRQERYSLLRGAKLPGAVLEQLESILQQGTCDTFLLLQHSPAIGRTLAEAGLEGGAGAQVVAAVRNGRAVPHADPEFRLQVGDTLVLTGTHADMERAFRRLTPEPAREGEPQGAGI
jgi:CPA2 family monovalent cation:H+ antiporter-2